MIRSHEGNIDSHDTITGNMNINKT